MTNVKPTLPREVANAIESARKEDRDNFAIMRQAHGAVFTDDLLTLKRYAFLGEHGGTPDLLMSALINGYEVEQSPEDKLREYYEHILSDLRSCIPHTDNHSRNLDKVVTVRTTLNTLGIKIDGINALPLHAMCDAYRRVKSHGIQ